MEKRRYRKMKEGDAKTSATKRKEIKLKNKYKKQDGTSHSKSHLRDASVATFEYLNQTFFSDRAS